MASLLTRFARRALPMLVTALVLVSLAGPVEGSRVRRLGVDEMVPRAGYVFVARVVGTQPAEVRGLPVTRVTFEIEEGLRGTSGDRQVLTFPGGVNPETGRGYRIAGMPRFEAGQRVVLLAHPESAVGLTSPVGLSQGVFRLSSGPAGLQQVAAGSGRQPVGTFLERLRALVRDDDAAAEARP